jgi:4a-hydroxytetrahydrobiopterin dehydratase
MAYDKTPLSPEALQEFLESHPEWGVLGAELVRTYEFPNFPAGIAFVSRVAELAEREDHHPDIDVRFRKVTLRLTTHAASGLTFRDPKLAALADEAFAGGRDQ